MVLRLVRLGVNGAAGATGATGAAGASGATGAAGAAGCEVSVVQCDRTHPDSGTVAGVFVVLLVYRSWYAHGTVGVSRSWCADQGPLLSACLPAQSVVTRVWETEGGRVGGRVPIRVSTITSLPPVWEGWTPIRL